VTSAGRHQTGLRTTHGEEEFEKLSGHYLADEVAGNYRAIDKLVEQAAWDRLPRRPAEQFWESCVRVATEVQPGAFQHIPGDQRTKRNRNAPEGSTVTTTPPFACRRRQNENIESDSCTQPVGAAEVEYNPWHPTRLPANKNRTPVFHLFHVVAAIQVLRALEVTARAGRSMPPPADRPRGPVIPPHDGRPI
jgi:hypothetical protein